LFDALAGIVFLGTPHLRESNKSEWNNVPAILELHTPSPCEDLRTEYQLRRLATWSQEFENLNLLTPVLSTQEGKKSKKKKTKKWSLKSASENMYIVVREEIEYHT